MQTIRNRPTSHDGAASTNHRHNDYTTGLKRRRAAAYRVPVLECGQHRDPWVCTCYTLTEPSDHQVDAYSSSCEVLFAMGLTPAPRLPELRIMWRRGGIQRRLAREISARWEVAA